ncbi:MAG: serine/threonine protein kinase, partial [Candidatus Krumholzibacteriota bacterium]|nr:serine/threonine protein kinase [Candidatus Krumholzibacteriota bacterium]
MIGRILAHYEILARLGEGAMGEVYRARDLKLERDVALKFLKPQAVGGGQDRDRFLREARAAAALDHPNICTVHEIGEAEGRTYIAMACVEGPSLRERIDAGPLALDEALDLAVQAASGLKAAHAKGIVHRDVKPANIMLDAEGRATIMDFGLARTADATRLTQDGSTLGTAAYMAPEQAQGLEAGPQADVWALGVVLFEMLTGRLPFRGEHVPALMFAIVHEEPTPLRELAPDLPAGLERVVGRALAKDPQRRYPDMAA